MGAAPVFLMKKGKEKMKKYLIAEFGGMLARVDAEEIMYILRDGGRIIVATEGKEYIYYESMKEAQEIMGPSFYQPRDRCIVNMEYLRRIEVKRCQLVFKDGEEVFLGRDACYALKKVFKKYIIENILYVAEDETPYE